MNLSAISKLAVLVLFLSVCGCAPLSKFPLKNLDDFEVDSRLPGIWVAEINGSETVLTFSRFSEDGTLSLLWGRFLDKGGMVSHQFQVFASPFGSQNYLNIEIEMKDSKTRKYVFASYKIDRDNALLIKVWSPEEISNAMEKGILPGTILKRDDEELLIKDPMGHEIIFQREKDIREMLGWDDEDNLGEWLGPYKKLMTPKTLGPSNQK